MHIAHSQWLEKDLTLSAYSFSGGGRILDDAEEHPMNTSQNGVGTSPEVSVLIKMILVLGCAVFPACQDPGAVGSESVAGVGHEVSLGHPVRDVKSDGGSQTGPMPAALRIASIRSIQEGASPAYRVVTSGVGSRAMVRADNPAHAFQTQFSHDGFQVSPAGARTGAWQLGLRLIGYGYQGQVQPVLSARPNVSGNRVEYRRVTKVKSNLSGLTEWYLNGPLGLEQGFTLPTPPIPAGADRPAGNTPLVLKMAVSGTLRPRMRKDRKAIIFNSPKGRAVLVYRDLYAQDATGRVLPAWLSVSEDGIAIRVSDTGAVYPLTIDPLFTRETRTLGSGPCEAGWRLPSPGAFEDDDFFQRTLASARGLRVLRMSRRA